jgi:ABC-type branched-subunit amino acid transport system substrate-binding protein
LDDRGVLVIRKLQTRLIVAVVIGAVAAAMTMSGVTSAGAAAALDDGVSANSIEIGYITSLTGVAASTTGDADKGCKARIGRENASGGVNGRKLDVTYVDDQSSGANKTAAQDLVQNKHVFMIVNNSAFAFLTYQFLLDNHIPLIGGGYDGTYYGAPGNEEAISALGNVINATGVVYDGLPKVMKKMGATKVAALGYGISPSSTAAAENLQKYAVPEVGLKAVYTNTTVDFGTTDVGPQVLGIKNAGADAVYLPLDANTNLALVQGLAQNGVKMKSEILATGYGQQLLDQPVSKTFGPETLLASGWAPVELKTKATKQFQADLKKYAGVTGVPDFGLYTGYIDCDMAIVGLKNAGNPPTRAAFAPNLRKLGTYDQAGLACKPIEISAETYGKAAPTQCGWYVQIKNGKFVPFPSDGKAVSGNLIGASTVTTTTTTAPAGQ